MGSIPKDILDIEIDMFNTWMIGEDLSCEFIILDDKYKKEYQSIEKMAQLFV